MSDGDSTEAQPLKVAEQVATAEISAEAPAAVSPEKTPSEKAPAVAAPAVVSIEEAEPSSSATVTVEEKPKKKFTLPKVSVSNKTTLCWLAFLIKQKQNLFSASNYFLVEMRVNHLQLCLNFHTRIANFVRTLHTVNSQHLNQKIIKEKDIKTRHPLDSVLLLWFSHGILLLLSMECVYYL